MTTIYDIELSEDELSLIKSALQSETLALREHCDKTGNEGALYKVLALDLLRIRLEGIGTTSNWSLPAFLEDVQRYMSVIHNGVLGHKNRPW